MSHPHEGPSDYYVGEDEIWYLDADLKVARVVDLRTYNEAERSRDMEWYGPGPTPIKKCDTRYGHFSRPGYTVQYTVWKLMNRQARILVPLSFKARAEIWGPVPFRLTTLGSTDLASSSPLSP